MVRAPGDQERCSPMGCGLLGFAAGLLPCREELRVLRGFLMSRSMASATSAKGLCHHSVFTDIFVGFSQARRGLDGAARWCFEPPPFAPSGYFVLSVSSPPSRVILATISSNWNLPLSQPGVALFGWPPCAT